MYSLIALGAVLFAMTASSMAHLTHLAERVHPRVIQNGSDVVTLPFQPSVANILQSNVAFGPDGTGYFITASGAIEEVSPSGRYRSIPVPHAIPNLSYSVIYAHGKLWATADSGVVSVEPNGSRHRLYTLASPHTFYYTAGIADGQDGYVYVLAVESGFDFLYRISQQGLVTSVAFSQTDNRVGDYGLIHGAGGDFYSVTLNSRPQGIVRLRFDGSVAFYPTVTYNGNNSTAPAYSNGTLYFLVSSAAYVHERTVYTWYLERLDQNGVSILKTFASGVVATELAIDFGGNVWITTVDPSGLAGLYQYNVVTGGYGGPFIASTNWYGSFAVGSDDNIWLPMAATVTDGQNLHCCALSGFSVFVRHIQTLEPANVSVTPSQAAQFTILETHSNGPWTAVSQQPSIATVSPAISTSGTFTVNEVHSGSAQILVKDELGNFSYEAVTAQ